MGTKGFPHFTLCYPLPKEGTESWHTGLGLSTEQGPSEGNNKSKQAKGGMAKEANLTDCLVFPSPGWNLLPSHWWSHDGPEECPGQRRAEAPSSLSVAHLELRSV